MTVRGFLAWYLAAVVLVSASGAGAWLWDSVAQTSGHCRGRHPAGSGNFIAVTTGRRRRADAGHAIRSGRGQAAEAASTAVNCCACCHCRQLHVLMQSQNATQTASGANRSWTVGLRPRPARKVAARASTHRYPQTVVAQREDYPYEGPGPYVQAYPPAPWQVNRHAYYYPPYGYYPPYSYYYYPAN